LQLVLLDLIEQHGSEGAFDTRAMVLARRTLALACGGGVSESVSEYTRLMQAEAAGRAQDLNAAVAALNELQRQRADAWREAAHELRNTVGVVTNATGILKREDAPEPMRAKSLVTLQSSVATLRTMLNDMLELARLEAGLEERAIALVDVSPLLCEVIEKMQAATRATGIALSAEGSPRLEVEADVQKLSRLSEKLIESVLAKSRGGDLSLSWGPIEESDPHHWMLELKQAAEPLPDAPVQGQAQARPAPLGGYRLFAGQTFVRIVRRDFRGKPERRALCRPRHFPLPVPEYVKSGHAFRIARVGIRVSLQCIFER
jgi:hypothetical protein